MAVTQNGFLGNLGESQCPVRLEVHPSETVIPSTSLQSLRFDAEIKILEIVRVPVLHCTVLYQSESECNTTTALEYTFH